MSFECGQNFDFYIIGLRPELSNSEVEDEIRNIFDKNHRQSFLVEFQKTIAEYFKRKEILLL